MLQHGNRIRHTQGNDYVSQLEIFEDHAQPFRRKVPARRFVTREETSHRSQPRRPAECSNE